ncbi:indoleamine 2,3-dioxygenase [Cordyceps fumosorosea ARSEF 2679]|uniref:Indoleamine 2,3-dioxygenase n=1 Tax=Cordyceps fumosorosea (strain ARSEF 2679) TaxID=1081104 RepID=A0A167SVN3_CORFA|nr:indoleamine 2,3-dioxygenase [Cordyceps fumosorosea ARSEF 2679]OAA59970.1 indoleamine 2,3-dioxygenase [Cordyceps fumosorosea ARSEF 2679]
MAPITLKRFDITKNAFLPTEPPLACLPNTYYQPWEAIAQDLPALIRNRELSIAVKYLPFLDVDYLATEPEWRRAYVALPYSLMPTSGEERHRRRRGTGGGEVPEEQISVPLRTVSAHVELPPVLTCAAVNVWNYTVPDPRTSLTDPDALSVPTTFTGTDSEAWFQRIGTAIEAQGGPVVDALLTALHAIHSGGDDLEPVTAALVQLRMCLESATRTLERMHERCDPLTFCHQIRHFYAESRNLRAAGLPRGVFYSSDACGGGEWMRLPGGSNGQSALLQLFDVVLGMGPGCGGGCGCGRREEYHLGTRACTPGPHRRFLEWAAQAGSIRVLALCVGVDVEEQARLRAAFAGAAEAMSAFRTKHIQIVTRYIAMPLKRPWLGSVQRRSLPLLLPSGLGDDGVKGTAGTTMLEFLKSLGMKRPMRLGSLSHLEAERLNRKS